MNYAELAAVASNMQRNNAPAPPMGAEFNQALDLDRIVVSLETATGGSWGEPGGALKWSPVDWNKCTRLPYLLSQRVPQSRLIARERLAAWAEYCRRFNVTPTAELLFRAWERGLMLAMTQTKNGKRPSEFVRKCIEAHG